MHIKITTAAIAVLLARIVSAQVPGTESAERVVHLTTTPTPRDIQEMATALRSLASDVPAFCRKTVIEIAP